MHCPGVTKNSLGLLVGLLSCCIVGGLVVVAQAMELIDADTSPLYFESPQAAVPVITDLLEAENWPTLARYYDLSGSDVDRAELVSGRFLIRTERPEVAHPAGFWRYKHPFAPGFKFSAVHDTGADGVVQVVVMVEIDQGGGMIQRGLDSFFMRRFAKGYQILPPVEDEGDATLVPGPLPVPADEVTVTASLVPPKEPLTVGLFAGGLRASIQNEGPFPVALVAVQWAGYREDLGNWRRRIYGATRETLEGNVEFDMLAQQLTQHEFDHGLILPGEQLEVAVPITPQRDGRHNLLVSYEVIGGDWMGRVLLADAGTGARNTLYRPVTKERLESGLRAAGANAILRPDAAPRSVNTDTFHLQIPIARDPMFSKTGPMSYVEASRRAGLSPETQEFWSYYRAPLEAWFFVRSDRTAVALVKAPNLNPELPPKAPPGFKPKNYKWAVRKMPRMDVSVPDDFCLGEDNATRMLLHPAEYGDLIDCNTPKTDMYYDPGETSVPSRLLWSILGRAAEKSRVVELVRIDPNGLGGEYVLTAGVEVDPAGRWYEPDVESLKCPVETGELLRELIAIDARTVNGTLMVPVRETFSAMGYQVQYTAATRTIAVYKGPATVRFSLGAATGMAYMAGPGREFTWPVLPGWYRINGKAAKTYVPLLATCEALELPVEDRDGRILIGTAYELAIQSLQESGPPNVPGRPTVKH